MDESLQHVTQRKQKRGRTPAEKSISSARSLRVPPQRMMQLNQLEAIWEAFPEGLIACDSHQKIVRINAAARKLFEVDSEAQCRGRDYQQFLTSYLRFDEQPPLVSSEPWLMSLTLAGTTGIGVPDQTLLHLPSGRKISVMVHTFPVRAQECNTEETVSIFYCWPEIFYLQGVHKAMLGLLNAIAQIPEQMDLVLPEETFLLSPPVLFVTQQVVDVIQCVLNCLRVNMVAFGCRTGHLYFVAGSGWTAEQEQDRRDIGGLFSPSEALGDAAFARLSANQEVILARDLLPSIARLGKQLPFPAHSHPPSPGSETFLLLPLFLEQQWVGYLAVVKATSEGEYAPEEIALAKAVTAQTMLVIKGIHCLCAQEEKQERALVQDEVHHLVGDFLTLASHELRTPLTGVMGNLQLAQRRLKTFKDPFMSSSVQIHEPLTHIQQPLAAAAAAAQLQQRMINDVIDDARIQTNTLPFSLRQEDLGTLLREVVTRQQHATPEHPIVLDVPPLDQGVPILADARLITYVLTTYLMNARASSPPGRPIKVHVRVEEAFARISIHNEGTGIAREDLDHLWERFYRAKGSGIQHELDLSSGLPLYLCRVFMERHHGSVGVQSAPGEGATFWLTVPITSSPGT